MTTSKLQQTDFHIEKLKNVVNVGHSTAYQILTSPGRVLGQLGIIADTAIRISANDDRFGPAPAGTAHASDRVSWIKKTLSALRSR